MRKLTCLYAKKNPLKRAAITCTVLPKSEKGCKLVHCLLWLPIVLSLKQDACIQIQSDLPSRSLLPGEASKTKKAVTIFAARPDQATALSFHRAYSLVETETYLL
jgi:hypothetical protein